MDVSQRQETDYPNHTILIGKTQLSLRSKYTIIKIQFSIVLRLTLFFSRLSGVTRIVFFSLFHKHFFPFESVISKRQQMKINDAKNHFMMHFISFRLLEIKQQ